MKRRCSTAEPVGSIKMKGFNLVFRSVADIAENPDGEVMIGLWRISDFDLACLDVYEGFPSLYTKIYRETERGLVMLYQMRERSWIQPPTNGYLESIADGYEDFGFNHQALQAAVKDSYRRDVG